MRSTRRGTTLLELIVASGILLIMVFMTSTAVVSYVRAYHQYTERGLLVRQAAKTLEVVAQHLRSMESIETQSLDQGLSCAQTPLVFRQRTTGLKALALNDKGQLELQDLDPQGHKKGAVILGKARTLTVRKEGQASLAHLHITLDFGEGAPLETDVALRGVAQ